MSAPADGSLARLIGGRYEVETLIASGGMGSVYRAQDVVLGRTVAVKLLREDSDALVDRFRTEATNAARLSHPNVVAIYDLGEEDGRPYIAMEYVPGQTLREVLRERRVLRPEAATTIALAVAEALEHARRAGIVHRDVKPENILITGDGRVKVADFGLSRALAASRVTQEGSVIGTAHYLAPEQVRGEESDHRADVYALGTVLFEMLTGHPPFGGESPAAVASRRLVDDVPRPSSINPAVPESLDLAVARATEREPDRRFATAAAMAAALRQVIPSGGHDLSGLVEPTGPITLEDAPTLRIGVPERRTKRRRRRRRHWLAFAALLLLAAVGGTMFAVLGPLDTTQVPDVVARPQADAKRSLDARGLRGDVVVRNHEQIEPGLVIEQDPSPGTEVRSGAPVTLVVSLGPLLVPVPDVEGLPFARAQQKIRDEGFRAIEREDVFSTTVARSHVIRQEPKAGMPVVRATTITLTVSKGVEMVAVPDVAGDTEASARSTVEAARLRVEVTRKRHETVPAGEVISQSPAAGKRVPKGSTVTVVVSEGPPLATVPDLRCMTQRQAQDALAHDGFRGRFEGRGRRVVDQAPAPGERVPKGSVVTVYMGHGSFC